MCLGQLPPKPSLFTHFASQESLLRSQTKHLRSTTILVPLALGAQFHLIMTSFKNFPVSSVYIQVSKGHSPEWEKSRLIKEAQKGDRGFQIWWLFMPSLSCVNGLALFAILSRRKMWPLINHKMDRYPTSSYGHPGKKHFKWSNGFCQDVAENWVKILKKSCHLPKIIIIPMGGWVQFEMRIEHEIWKVTWIHYKFFRHTICWYYDVIKELNNKTYLSLKGCSLD